MLVGLLRLTACNIGVPEEVSINDPKIAPLLEAANKIDRTKLGFTPIPQWGTVRVEWNKGGVTYDVMLHMGNHEMAFRKTQTGYEWIYEGQTFIGPKVYSSPDGKYHEEINIQYQTVESFGKPVNKVIVTYTGEDPRLINTPWPSVNFNLTLADVTPIIREWNSAKK